MRRSSYILLFLLLVVPAMALNEGRFMRYPDIRGDKIVFTYENDLWLVSSKGGTAARITTAPGAEYATKFSPDGKWIAFTGLYDGSRSVYIMPAEGGEPRRLTYIPGRVQTVGWTPDGGRVVFRTDFEMVNSRDPNLYFVSKDGSVPERFPIDRGTLCSISADGSKILYNRRGREEIIWKRYKGGFYQDIWMYDFNSKIFTPVSDYVGKNSYPMWVGDSMVFVSDRTNGIVNLYSEDLKTKSITQITSYADVDVRMPATDGERIVYLHDGYLNVLDIASHLTTTIHVNIPSDRWQNRPKIIVPTEYIHGFDISNEGKEAVIEARGDLFLVPTKDGRARNLSDSPGTREMYPAISPDGKSVAFFSDRSGEYQLYMQGTDGGAWTQLTTTLDRTDYHILWSPDGTKILFGNKDFSIFVLDVASKELTQIDQSNQLKNDEFFWELSDYTWSPDGKWVAYSFVQYNRNNQIFLYSLEKKKRFAVTDDFYDNRNPAFDAAGGYLYYLSSRNFDVTMDFYEDNHILGTPMQVMAVQLRDGEKPPFLDDSKETKDPAAAPENPMRIDIEGLAKRTYPVPVPAGNYFFLRAGKGMIAWCSVPKFTEDEYEELFNPKGATKWTLTIFDMQKNKSASLAVKISDYRISAGGEQLITRRGSDFSVTSVESAYESSGSGEKLDLSTMMYTVDQQKEWNQIFSDTWRWYRDFFYDPGMHGHDWKAIGEKYRAYIPDISSRDELNGVLEQMVGELSVSHTYISGGDNGDYLAPVSKQSTGRLGADLVADPKSGYYRFAKIYGPTDFNLDLTGPLVRPDFSISEGDYLIAIDGKPIRYPDDYYKYLQVTEGQKVELTVNSKPTADKARTYSVEPIQNDEDLRYYRWVSDNMNAVLKATGGRVGYMHITAMGADGVGEFDKFWRAFRFKEGVIVDVRRNSGGWTEYFLIDKLERAMTAYNVLRGMVPFRYPGSAGNGQYVAISNEYNGSDGEAFLEDFRARKLGSIVGVPSWGGLVGIVNTQTTIDNGKVDQSNNAFFGGNGTWLVENHGVDPDFVVDNDPASVMAGRDAQLEKAIEVIKEKIKNNPFTFPAQPPYPKK